MLATKLAALLLALPLALAQDASASAEVTPSAEFTTAEAVPAADVSPTETAEAVEASIATPTSTASGNVGANIANTGNGETSGSGNWSLVEFTAPSREHYWVLDVENTAIWEAYTEPVNLVLFNSNTEIFGGNATLAENIPAGAGVWKGSVSDFNAGNNYIIAIALSSDPSRKVGQTAGFWIKAAGTKIDSTLDSSSDSNVTTATGTLTGDATATSTIVAASISKAAAPSSTATSGAGAIKASAGLLAAAALFALTF